MMKLNSTSILAFVLIILAVTAFFLYKKNGNSKEMESKGFAPSESQFAIPDLESIATISINRALYPELVFKRHSTGWKINNRFEANDVTMNYFLAVVKGVSMKYIPPKSAYDNLMADFKKNGIVLQFFDVNGKKLKQYTVGTELGDGSDTPFIMEGANQPYIVHLPGMDGSVRRRMNHNIDEWKSIIIAQEDPNSISKLKVTYPLDTPSSFTIIKKDDGYQLISATGKDLTDLANQNTIRSYLDGFAEVLGESNESGSGRKDEIIAQPLFAKIEIKRSNGEHKILEFYSFIDMSRGEHTTSPNQVNPDNKFFVNIDKSDFILGQYRVLQKIIKAEWFFL